VQACIVCLQRMQAFLAPFVRVCYGLLKLAMFTAKLLRNADRIYRFFSLSALQMVKV